MALLAALAAVPSACNRQPEGAVKVAVIGADAQASSTRRRAAVAAAMPCC